MSKPDPRLSALTSALDRGGLTPVFQPILTMNGEHIGFEALSRFSNGCPPDAVWAYAEKWQVADELDNVALEAAIAAARELPGKLFLNISAAHLTKALLLARFGSPDRIVWEVTETAVQTEAARRGVDWLKSKGYHVAMDDAGAGFSTEERLKWLRPHVVKLDRSIVQEFALEGNRTLLEWIAHARQVKALILAEGVEDMDWLPDLSHHGVEAVQGYALGRPEKAQHWLNRPMLSSG
jgi:EAL domain-containing protein (putative c-di-GMP-specific phosphodiesterase class I)